jgi:hypothetical protein
VGLSHSFSEKFQLKIRALYELKGSKLKTRYSADFADRKNVIYTEYANNTFKYLTITLLPTFKFGAKNKLRIGGGGYYSFLKGYKLEDSLYDESKNITTKKSTRDIRNLNIKYDMGISAFACHDLYSSNKISYVLQLQYNKGIVSIIDYLSGSQRNNSLMLVLSVNLKNNLTR